MLAPQRGRLHASQSSCSNRRVRTSAAKEHDLRNSNRRRRIQCNGRATCQMQQFGMIRQPRRSTAAPAASQSVATEATSASASTSATTRLLLHTRSQRSENNNSFKFAFALLIGALLLNTCVGAWPATNDYEEEAVAGAMAVGSSSHAPKFGERLLPRSKKTSTNLKFGASGSNTTTTTTTTTTTIAAPIYTSTKTATTTTTTMKSVNSLNINKNNYVISNSASQKQQQRHEDETNLKKNSALNNSEKSDVSEVLTVVPLEDFYVVKTRRQSKQLHRREDVNVAEVHELAEQPPEEDLELQQQRLHPKVESHHHPVAANASSLKADRFIEMSTEFFIVPSPSPSPSATAAISASGSSSTTTPRNPTKTRNSMKASRGVSTLGGGGGGGIPRSVLVVAPKITAPNVNNNFSASAPTIVSTHLHSGLRKEPWVVPVLVLATLTMLMMAAFEIFVLFKAWRTSPSRRHLFLGQMLLLGLFACAGLGAIITAQPSLLTCGTLRFGVGVAYALVFAALLVKCVFLISLNGGVYLPAPYQGLLLLFAVLIQVAIGAQWLLTTPPEIYTLSVPIVVGGGVFASASVASSTLLTSNAAAAAFARVFSAATASAPTPAELYTHASHVAGGMLIPLCKTQFSELLLSLVYILFLIVFVSVLAIKSRGIRDNYREATYIGLAIGGAIPIWLGWMLCGLAVAERHKDACVAFGLVATSATVFLVMFMPKGRQLAAMGKEGLYVEDREEQFSSLSRAGSGYSPSFFHFKPIKYGVMGGGLQHSASNTGNAPSMKHCSNGINGGAHLTHPFCFYPQPPPVPPPPPPPLQHVAHQLAPPPPPTLKQLGTSVTSMTQAQIAQTLRYPGLFIRPDETNLYTTLEPTLSSNPNVYFQRGNAVHPGMMY